MIEVNRLDVYKMDHYFFFGARVRRGEGGGGGGEGLCNFMEPDLFLPLNFRFCMIFNYIAPLLCGWILSVRPRPHASRYF